MDAEHLGGFVLVEASQLSENEGLAVVGVEQSDGPVETVRELEPFNGPGQHDSELFLGVGEVREQAHGGLILPARGQAAVAVDGPALHDLVEQGTVGTTYAEQATEGLLDGVLGVERAEARCVSNEALALVREELIENGVLLPA